MPFSGFELVLAIGAAAFAAALTGAIALALMVWLSGRHGRH